MAIEKDLKQKYPNIIEVCKLNDCSYYEAIQLLEAEKIHKKNQKKDKQYELQRFI